MVHIARVLDQLVVSDHILKLGFCEEEILSPFSSPGLGLLVVADTDSA